jgi:breast cancer 2 susceptibility protein
LHFWSQRQLTRLTKAKRQAAESKLREAHEKKVRRYLGYAERLEQKAGGKLRGDEPPDSVENMYDELEEPEDAGPVLARATSHEAGWLARYIRDRIEKDQDRVRDEIEKELNVRSTL